MNTGNLQLEGLYLAVAALVDLLVAKGLVRADEVDGALALAEETAASDPHVDQLSRSNRDAMLFPIRILRMANNSSSGEGTPPFSELTRQVGELK
jgi:hypothetical protein